MPVKTVNKMRHDPSKLRFLQGLGLVTVDRKKGNTLHHYNLLICGVSFTDFSGLSLWNQNCFIYYMLECFFSLKSFIFTEHICEAGV